MLTNILEYFGFRPCKDVWAENERLKTDLVCARAAGDLVGKKLAAAEINTQIAVAAHTKVIQEKTDLYSKYRDACLRVIELEHEVNNLSWSYCRTRPYPQKR